MVSFLQIEKLTKSFGDNLLFSDVTLGLFEGDKIGIIASNGAGKTTFLNILAGSEDFDSGKITYKRNLKIGYLPQEPKYDPSLSAIDYILGDLIPEEKRPESEAKALKLLSQFKVDNPSQKMDSMSGGQIKKVALAKVLLDDLQLLILDEPTNHLDIQMVEWLETYLSKAGVTLVMVTHDRYFLDKVCNKIIEIDRKEFYQYDGNFSYYLEKRQERYDSLLAEQEKLKNILRKEQEWMRRQPQARATKAKFRIDNFHGLQEKRKKDLGEKKLTLSVKSSYIGSKIFEAKNVSKSFGEITILKNWNYNFARYEKIGIVGANGTGKSSFIKLLLGEIKPDEGFFDIGQTIKWGYYSQEGMPIFNDNKKVIDIVREIAEDVSLDGKTRISVSQFLTNFLFPPETQQKYIHKLSGGEKRRLYLATVLMKQPNFLILDEPTNDLDIMTLAVLEEYIAEFKGCVIVVSHDRFFLDRIADHLFIFKGGGEIKDFPGDYTTYRDVMSKEQRDKHGLNEEGKDKKKEKRAKPTNTRKLTFKERQEMDKLSAEIERLEKEKKEKEDMMNSGNMDHRQLAIIGNEIASISETIDSFEIRLLELMEKSEN